MDAKHTLGEPRALISRSALLHNIALIRQSLKPGVKICAIIKADAYGHGATIVADTLCNFSAAGLEAPVVDALAVASIDEACELPATDLPVYIFRPVENTFVGTQRDRLELAIRSGWTLTICTPSAAEDVARVALAIDRRASIQMMIDTGMSRSGVLPDQLSRMMNIVTSRPSLKLSALCTHFACSEQADHSFNTEQLSRFRQSTDGYIEDFTPRGKSLPRHAANSGAIFFMPDSHLDMVRPGISIFGIDPTCRPNINRKLQPVMKWTAPLIQIKDLPPGTGVGYGQTWQTPRNTRIGLVPIGYADGYSRSFSNRAVMMLNGHPAPVIGRVSMDLTTIDLSRHPNACIGDEVTIIDDDPLSPASIYRLAELAETIPYELFCRIGSRIHRVAVESNIQANSPQAFTRDVLNSST